MKTGGIGMISNEVLFYGGMTVAGTAAALLLIFIIAHIIGGIRLNAKFDSEYGEKNDTGNKGRSK